MSKLVPHLLLRASSGASHSATLLRLAGYMVSKVNEDAMLERIAGAPHVDGVVVELPALAAISIVRRIDELYRHNVVIVVISREAEAVRKVLPSIRVLKPEEIDYDLISAVDLTLAAHQMQRTG